MLESRADPGPRRSPVSCVPDAEFTFSESDFATIAALLYEEAGIRLRPGKAPLVYARLARRLRTLGLQSFADYIALLRNEHSGERGQLVVALTTNVTRFFREPHHFEHLRNNVVLPALSRLPRGARLRFWSAACSTGQEPYSLAAMIAEVLSGSHEHNIRILATDIDREVLAAGERGRYGSLDGVPDPARRWFKRDGSSWIVDDHLRSLITFRHLNLNAAWPLRGPFEAILCRNVAIYFDQQVQERLWSKFASVLNAGAFLYIGHSERVSGPASDLFESAGITTYRRRGNRT